MLSISDNTDWDDPAQYSAYLATLDQTQRNDRLWWDAGWGDLQMTELGVLNGAQVNCRVGDYGSTPLMRACIKNQLDVVRYLAPLSDMSKTDDDGDTALHYCIEGGSFECLNALIESGADLSIPNSKGNPAFFLAIQMEGHFWEQNVGLLNDGARCFDLLFSSFHDSSLRNSDGLNAIEFANRLQLHQLSAALKAKEEHIAISQATPHSSQDSRSEMNRNKRL